jgi:hypothetical protein
MRLLLAWETACTEFLKKPHLPGVLRADHDIEKAGDPTLPKLAKLE